METKGFIPIPLNLYKAIEKLYYEFRNKEKSEWEDGYTMGIAKVLNLIDGKDEIIE